MPVRMRIKYIVIQKKELESVYCENTAILMNFAVSLRATFIMLLSLDYASIHGLEAFKFLHIGQSFTMLEDPSCYLLIIE